MIWKERMKEIEPPMESDILLLGGSGFVGGEALSALSEDVEVDSPSSESLDITNARQIVEYIADSKATSVWLNAAHTEVKKLAEGEKIDPQSPAWQINVNGVINVTNACERYGKFLILTSTGYVFKDGDGPYEEDQSLPDINELNNAYAMTKLIGETFAKEAS